MLLPPTSVYNDAFVRSDLPFPILATVACLRYAGSNSLTQLGMNLHFLLLSAVIRTIGEEAYPSQPA